MDLPMTTERRLDHKSVLTGFKDFTGVRNGEKSRKCQKLEFGKLSALFAFKAFQNLRRRKLSQSQ